MVQSSLLLSLADLPRLDFCCAQSFNSNSRTSLRAFPSLLLGSHELAQTTLYSHPRLVRLLLITFLISHCCDSMCAGLLWPGARLGRDGGALERGWWFVACLQWGGGAIGLGWSSVAPLREGTGLMRPAGVSAWPAFGMMLSGSSFWIASGFPAIRFFNRGRISSSSSPVSVSS